MNNLLKVNRAAQDDTHFVTLVRELSQSNEALTIKAAKLQAENHYLRRANRVRPHLRLVLRARAAADILVVLHLAGYRTGRNAAEAAGVSQDSWFAGRALLLAARLWDNGLTTTDSALIESRLSAAYQRAMADPSTVAFRIPMSRRPKSWLGK